MTCSEYCESLSSRTRRDVPLLRALKRIPAAQGLDRGLQDKAIEQDVGGDEEDRDGDQEADILPGGALVVGARGVDLFRLEASGQRRVG